MNKTEQIFEYLTTLLDRDTVDRFVEDVQGNLARIETIDLRSVAEEINEKFVEPLVDRAEKAEAKLVKLKNELAVHRMALFRTAFIVRCEDCPYLADCEAADSDCAYVFLEQARKEVKQ